MVFLWFLSRFHRNSGCQAYKSSVQRLLPSWASDMGDPAQQSAERHLGELQFTIEVRSSLGEEKCELENGQKT